MKATYRQKNLLYQNENREQKCWTQKILGMKQIGNEKYDGDINLTKIKSYEKKTIVKSIVSQPKKKLLEIIELHM